MHNRIFTLPLIYRTISLFVLFALLSFLHVIPSWVHPNVFLVFAVVAGFVLPRFALLLLVLLLEIIWLRYSPFFEPEYVVLFCVGIASFFLMRFFFFKKAFWILIVMIGIFQIIFWVSMYGFSSLLHVSFLIEFFYNILVGLFFYLTNLWLERRFS